MDAVLFGFRSAELKALCTLSGGTAFVPESITAAQRLFESETVISLAARSDIVRPLPLAALTVRELRRYGSDEFHYGVEPAPRRPAGITRPVRTVEGTLRAAVGGYVTSLKRRHLPHAALT